MGASRRNFRTLLITLAIALCLGAPQLANATHYPNGSQCGDCHSVSLPTMIPGTSMLKATAVTTYLIDKGWSSSTGTPCLLCHRFNAVSGDTSAKMKPVEGHFGTGVASKHDAAEASIAEIDTDKFVCVDCHDGILATVVGDGTGNASIHGRNASVDNFDLLYLTMIGNPTDGSDVQMGKVCVSCHDADGTTGLFGVDAAPKHSIANATLPITGAEVAPTECTQCHAKHRGNDQPSLMVLLDDGTTYSQVGTVPGGKALVTPADCGACHTADDSTQGDDYANRGHGMSTIWGGTMACDACHDETIAHDFTGVNRRFKVFEDKTKTSQLTDKYTFSICIGCHIGLEDKVHDSDGTTVTNVGCLDCHEAHGQGLHNGTDYNTTMVRAQVPAKNNPATPDTMIYRGVGANDYLPIVSTTPTVVDTSGIDGSSKGVCDNADCHNNSEIGIVTKEVPSFPLSIHVTTIDHGNGTIVDLESESCGGCHLHSDPLGTWGASTACDSCHASVPVTRAHTTHVVDASLGCTTCHPSGSHNEAGVADSTEYDTLVANDYLGFRQKVDVGFASAVAYQDGTYSQAKDGRSAGVYGTCNTSCHGATLPANTKGTNQTPQWDNPGDDDANCGTCHKANDGVSTTWPTTNEHTIHADTAGRNIGCDRCHYSSFDGTSLINGVHVNGSVDVAPPPGAASVTFNGVLVDFGFTTLTCDTISCHGEYSDVDWDVGTSSCDNCHGTLDLAAYDGTPSPSGGMVGVVASHKEVDWTDIQSNSWATNFGNSHKGATSVGSNAEDMCNICHANSDLADNYTTAMHIDGKVQINDQMGYVTDDVDFGCINSCHSYTVDDYQMEGSQWPIDPITGGTLACGICHTGGVGPGGTSLSHAGHGLSFASIAADEATCEECHPVRTYTIYDGSEGHGDGSFDIATDLDSSKVNYSGGTCLTVACHNDDQSAPTTWDAANRSTVWDTATKLECDDCHYYEAVVSDNNNNALHESGGLSNRHDSHLDAGKQCAMCHAVPSDVPAENTGHVTGATDLQDMANAVFTDDAAVDGSKLLTYTSPTCLTNYDGLGCHASATVDPAWNAAQDSLACTDCHTDNATPATNPTSGLHDAAVALQHSHPSFDATNAATDCTDCHDATSPSDLHQDGTKNNASQGTWTWNANISATTYKYTQADGCAATCHIDGGTWAREWSTYTDAVPSGSDAVGDAVCENCHDDGVDTSGDVDGIYRKGVLGYNGTDLGHQQDWDVAYDAGEPGEVMGANGTPPQNHAVCENCHGWGHANYNEAWSGVSTALYDGHGDHYITMNGPAGTGTEYSDTNFDCASACHKGAPNTDHALRESTLPLPNNFGDFGSGACGACHTDGVGPSGTSATHAAHGVSYATIVGDESTCEECHPTRDYTTSHNGALEIDATKVTYSGGENGTCLTVSCHNKDTGSDVSPTWDTSSVLLCDDCHYYELTTLTSGENTAATTSLTSSHGAHFDAGKVCADCHTNPDGTDINTMTHASGANLIAQSTPSASNATVTATGWTTGPTCGSAAGVVGCHATGIPTWGDAATADACIECHTDNATGIVNPTSGLHDAATAIQHSYPSASFDLTNAAADCTDCHDAGVSGTDHQDGVLENANTVTYAWNTTNILNGGYDEVGDGCTATCHGDSLPGSNGDAGTWARKWIGATDATPADTDAQSAGVCLNCHGVFGDWNIPHADLTTTSHLDPDGSNAGNLDSVGYHANCTGCHAWNDTAYEGNGFHQNGKVTMNSTLGFTPADGECSTNCHSATRAMPTNVTNWESDTTPDPVAGPGVGCGSCHNDGTVPPTSGAHAIHLDAARGAAWSDNGDYSACEACHGDNGGDGYDTVLTGSHGDLVAVDFAAAITYSDGGTPGTGAAADNDTCSTTNCHSPNAGNTAVWGDPQSVNCVDCHYYNATPTSAGNSAVTTRTLGNAHSTHFDAGAVTACTQCHAVPATSQTPRVGGHIDDLTVWASIGDDAVRLIDAALADTDEATISEGTFDDGANSCANASCHNPTSGGSYTSGSWTAPGAKSCDRCHADSTPGPVSGEHAQHMNAAGTFGKTIVCADCHNTLPTSEAHMDGGVDVEVRDVSGTYTTVASPLTQNGCGTNQCHNDGTGGAPRNVSASYDWDAGLSITNCEECHQDLVTTMTTNAHASHLQNGFTTVACSDCHTAGSDATNHLNAVVSFDGGKINSYGETADIDNSTFAGCDTASCHDQGATSAAWDNLGSWGTTGMACDSCHLATPTSGQHTAHVVTAGKPCSACHTVPTDDTHIDVKTTLQDGANTAAGEATITRAGTTFDQGVTNTCTGNIGLGCHASGTPDWDDAASSNDCIECHTDNAPGNAAFNPTSGLHDATVAIQHSDPSASFDLTNAVAGCTDCHASTVTNSDHRDGVLEDDSTSIYDWNTTNIPGGFDHTNDGCTAICHGDLLVGDNGDAGTWSRIWLNVTDDTPADADPATDPVCLNCHGVFTAWSIPHADGTTTNHLDPDASSAGNLGDVAYHADCTGCHAWGDAAYAGSHQNGSVTMNSTLGFTPVDGQCSTNCHSATRAMPTNVTNWESDNTPDPVAGPGVTCGACHDAGVTTSGESGAHAIHLATSAADLSDNPADCVNCHDAGDYTSTLLADAGADHGDGITTLIGVTYSAFVPATKGQVLTGTCLTADCHNDDSGTNQSGAWNTNALACDDCHYYGATVNSGNNTGADAIGGSHNVHFDAGAVTACTECHDVSLGETVAPRNHIDNATTLIDKSTATQDEATIKAGIGFTSGVDTCTTSACHNPSNDGHDSGDWASPGAKSCARCHADSTQVPGSGEHAQHLGAAATFGRTILCLDCHNTLPTSEAHMDGGVDVEVRDVSGTYTTVASPLVQNGCGTNQCHNDGTGGAPRNVSASYDWDAGLSINNCEECHQDLTANMSTNAHASHLQNGFTTVACSDCHTAGSDATNHLNAVVSFDGGKINSYGETADIDNSTFAGCDTASCHDQGATSAAWDNLGSWGTTGMACDSCHLATPTSGQHTAHVVTAGKPCSACHTVPTDDTHIDVKTTLQDGANATADEADVTRTEMLFSDGVADGLSGNNTCSNDTGLGLSLGCHATGAPDWDDAASSNDCTECHTDTATAAVNPTTGLHGITPTISEQRHDSLVGGLACDACHSTTPGASHQDGTLDAPAPADLDGASITSWDGTDCMASCHTNSGVDWAHKWPYTDTLVGSCAGCHGVFGGDGFNDGITTNGTRHLQGGNILSNHADGTGGAPYTNCGECHVIGQAAYTFDFTAQDFNGHNWDRDTGETSHHGDGKIQLNDNGLVYNETLHTCGNCHSTDNDNHEIGDTGWDISAGTRLTGTVAVAGNCTGCHTTGDEVLDAVDNAVPDTGELYPEGAYDDDDASELNEGAHEKHVDAIAAANSIGNGSTCDFCHPGNSHGGPDNTVPADFANYKAMNGDADSDAVYNMDAPNAVGAADNTCSNVNCHNNITTPDWYALGGATDTTAPSVIVLNAPTATVSNQIDLSWPTSGDDAGVGTADRYDIRYSTTSGQAVNGTQVSGEPTPQAAGNTDVYTVTGLIEGQIYYFAINVADEAGNWSGWSTEVNATVKTTAPTVPANFDGADAQTDGTVNLSWDASTDPDGSYPITYDLTWSGCGGAGSAPGLTTTNYQATSLTNDSACSFTLVAVDAKAQTSSPDATPLSGTITPTKPSASGGSSGTALFGATSGVGAKWDTVTDSSLDYDDGTENSCIGSKNAALALTMDDVSIDASAINSAGTPTETVDTGTPGGFVLRYDLRYVAGDGGGSMDIDIGTSSVLAAYGSGTGFTTGTGTITLTGITTWAEVSGIVVTVTTITDRNGSYYVDLVNVEIPYTGVASNNPPTTFTVNTPTENSGDVNISWSESTDSDNDPNNVVYNVYGSDNDGSTYDYVIATNVFSPRTAVWDTVDDNVATSGSVTAWIKIVANDQEGGLTTEYSATGFALDNSGDTTPPTFTPTNIAGTDDTTGGTVNLTWSAASDPSTPISYTVYWHTVAGSVFSAPLGTVSGIAGLGTQVTGLIDDTPYFFGVRATDSQTNTDTNTEVSSAVTPTTAGGGGGGATCATCHGVAWDGVGISHSAHSADFADPETDSATCDSCHPVIEAGGYDTSHSNGVYDFNFAGDVGAAAGYNGTYPDANNTCSGVDCHYENVTPTWTGVVPALTCTSCHNDGAVAVPGTIEEAWPAGTDEHAIHVANTNYVPSVTTDCTDCHGDNTTTHSTVDGTIVFSGSMGGYNTGTGQCSTNDCHDGTTSDFRTNASTLACLDCHAVSSTYIGDANKPFVAGRLHTAGTALAHDDSFTGGGVCASCHDTISGLGSHIDGTNTDLNTAMGLFAGYRTGTGDCATTCHDDNGTWYRKWVGVTDAKPLNTNNPGDPVCQNCHGDFSGWNMNEAVAPDHTDPDPDNTGDQMGAHTCEQCHGWGNGNYNETWGAAAPSHGEGIISMNSDLGYDNAGGCSTNCHTGDYSGGNGTLELDPVSPTFATNGAAYGGVSCGGCHTQGVTAASTDAWHSAHGIDHNTDMNEGGALCQPCHDTNGGPGFSSTPAGSHGNSADIEILPAFSYSAAATATPFDAVYSTCSNVTCHFSTTTPIWMTDNTDCTSCHNDGLVTVPGAVDEAWPSTNQDGTAKNANEAHDKHVANTNYVGAVDCTNCHADNNPTHTTIDGNEAVVEADITAGSSVSAYVPGSGTCTNACHSGALADFTDATPALSCADCHAGSGTLDQGTYPPTSDRHTRHIGGTNDYGFGCVECHGLNANTGGHANHVDGSPNIDLSSGVTNVDGGTWDGPANKTCATTYCHGSATADWDANTGGTCGDCHGNPPNPEPGASTFGTHQTGSHATTCDKCHDVTVPTEANAPVTHLNGKASGTFAAQVGGGSTSITSYTYGTAHADSPDGTDGLAYSGGTCNTISCHVGGSADWGQGSGIDCNGCHTYPPDGTGGSTNHLAANRTRDPQSSGPSTDADFFGAHGQCDTCHGVSGNADWNGSPTALGTFVDKTPTGDAYVAGMHGDGSVQLNGPGGANFPFDDANAGYNDAGGCTAACHTAPNEEWRFDVLNTTSVELREFGAGGCDGCHGNSAGQYWPQGVNTARDDATPNNSGAHLVHMDWIAQNEGWTDAADMATNGDQKIACEYCHAASTNDGDHMGTYPADVFDDSDAARHDGSFWAASDADADYDDSTELDTLTCSNVDCHYSNTTPSWYSTGALTCTSCHNDGVVTLGWPSTTKDGSALSDQHSAHLGNATYVNSNCTNCHPDNTTTHSDFTDGTIVTQSDITVGGASCTNNCHDRGTSTWTSGALACADCHSSGSLIGTGYPPTSFQHTRHLGGGSDYSFACIECHPHSGALDAAAHTSGHLNGTAGDIDMTAGGSINTTGAISAQNVCTATYCHGSGDPDWDVASAPCGSCHSNTDPATVKHTRHTGGGSDYDYSCQTCHDTVADATPAIISTALHVNGAKNVAFNSTMNPSGSWSSPTCSSLYCHGNQSPTWEVASTAACGTCHGDSNGRPDGADEPADGSHASTAHNAAPCTDCHTHDGTNYTEHVNGEASSGVAAAFLSSAGAQIGGYAYGASFGADSDGLLYSGGTCATIACHGGNPATWGGGPLLCDGCHGFPPTTSGVDHRGGGTDYDHVTDDADFIAKHVSNCTFCHGAGSSDGTINGTFTSHASYTGTWHGNNSTNVNSNTSYDDTDPGAGICGNNCHEVSNPVANYTLNVALRTTGGVTHTGFDTLSCTTCHSGASAGEGSGGVNGLNSHADSTTFTCEQCHGDHYDAGTRDAASVVNYGTVVNNSHGGISLGGRGVSGEASGDNGEQQFCNGCHAANTTDTSHQPWAETQGAYTTGTLSDYTNWDNATWTSANFSTYKPNTTQSYHYGAAGKGCTYCHDVHNGTNGDGSTKGVPYLRGSWVSNPFPEDGAPQTTAHATVHGGVPRAGLGSGLGNSPNTIGGWQIEQNNSPFSWTDYDTSASLCAQCHSGEDIRNAWGPHAAVVPGLGNTTSYTAQDIFNITDRGGLGNSNTTGHMMHQATTQDASSKYVIGLRDEYYGTGMLPQIAAGSDPQFGGIEVTIITVDDGTVDPNFHNFPCSKCHTPHMSALPRLMITNCLDVKRNKWDDDINPSGWGPGAYNSTQLAYSPTAVNCHRRVDVNDTNQEGPDDGEPGWNSVTPTW